MTIQASNLESEHLPDPAGGPPKGGVTKVTGQSPTHLAIGRFRKDRLSMVAFSVVVIYLAIAIAAPFLVLAGVLDPFTYHQDLTDPSSGGLPIGSYGGISWAHPLGVEPGTGRDVLSRLVYGVTFSLAIALVGDAHHDRRRHRRSASSPGSAVAGSTRSSAGSST